jgi:hypothetical protein
MVALHWPIAEPFEIVIGSEKRKKKWSRTLCFYYVIIEKYLN